MSNCFTCFLNHRTEFRWHVKFNGNCRHDREFICIFLLQVHSGASAQGNMVLIVEVWLVLSCFFIANAKLSRLHHGCFDTNPVQKQLAPNGVRIGIRPTQSPQIAYLTKKASGYLVRTMIKGTGHAFSNEEDRDFVKLHVKRQQLHLGVLWIYLSMANIMNYDLCLSPRTMALYRTCFGF